MTNARIRAKLSHQTTNLSSKTHFATLYFLFGDRRLKPYSIVHLLNHFQSKFIAEHFLPAIMTTRKYSCKHSFGLFINKAFGKRPIALCCPLLRRAALYLRQLMEYRMTTNHSNKLSRTQLCRFGRPSFGACLSLDAATPLYLSMLRFTATAVFAWAPSLIHRLCHRVSDLAGSLSFD